jgi:addiction module HigA family antidote
MRKQKMKPIHPGEVLLEDYLRPLRMSQNALAKAIGVPADRISEIVRGWRGITGDTALRLAHYFDTPRTFGSGYRPTMKSRKREITSAPSWRRCLGCVALPRDDQRG